MEPLNKVFFLKNLATMKRNKKKKIKKRGKKLKNDVKSSDLKSPKTHL